MDVGYPEAALADAVQRSDARAQIGHAAALINTLCLSVVTNVYCGNYTNARAEPTKASRCRARKTLCFGRRRDAYREHRSLSALIGEACDAVSMIDAGIACGAQRERPRPCRSIQSHLAKAHAMLGQFDEAQNHIDQAAATMEINGERFGPLKYAVIAGEVALLSPQQDAAKAEGHFEHALAVARQQQAKSWELRASMSLARLWRDQGKMSEARELLAPVYGWFTEGFDTRDLKEAKALLEELA